MIANEKDKRIIQSSILNANKEKFFDNKRVVIFGCTLYARDIRDALIDIDVKLDAFIDNNKEKWNKRCLGVNIFSPKEYVSGKDENFVVIIASKYHYEMKAQLAKLGVNESFVIDIPIGESLIAEKDDDEQLEQGIANVQAGLDIYKQILSKYGSEDILFVCPYPGTGDVYMACGFLEKYLKQHNIKNYILAVVGNNCVKVARLFGIKDIECITDEEKTRLLKAWEFLGSEVLNIKPLLYWGWRTKKYLNPRNYPQITFTEMFMYDVYGFDEMTEFRHPDIDRGSTFAKDLFEKYRLQKGKTVIIAPYAGSFVSEIKLTEWEKLVNSLISVGYDVCTNCYGEHEKPIKGTTPIQFPYEEVVNVLEYAGVFIAIRSGLCDIASSAKCKMIIIYENGFEASDKKYFGIRNMGLNTWAEEINYGDDENFPDTIMNLII